MAQQLRPLAALAENSGWFQQGGSEPSVTPVSVFRALTPSCSTAVSTACMWCTDIHADKTFTHLKNK